MDQKGQPRRTLSKERQTDLRQKFVSLHVRTQLCFQTTMAPPQLISLESYSDVQFRDVVHRRSMLVASNTGANVVQQLYHHHDGTSAKLSAAGLTTTDASGNSQFALIVSSNARSLDANTFTSANLAGWTANSVFTANATHFSVRAPTLTAGALSCTSLALGNDVKFANVTANNMIVTGNINIDTNTLTVDPALNRVGVVQASPAYPLDITGDVNTTGVLRINGTQVLSGTALGSAVLASSLTSVGTLGTLSVTGNASIGNVRTNAISATAVSGTVGTLTSLDVTNSFTAGNIGCVGNMGNNAILAQGTHLAFNSEFNGHSELVNKRGSGDGGFSFYSSAGTGSATEMSVNTRLARMNTAGLDIGNRTFTGGNVVLSTGTSFMPSLNVTTGSLTAYGTNHVLDSTASLTVTRTIAGSTVNSGVYLGNIVHLGACSQLEIKLNYRMDANNSVSKAYVIPLNPDVGNIGSDWKRALPISSSHAIYKQYSNDISLDVLWEPTQIRLAIARSKVGLAIASNPVVDVAMRITFQKSSGWNPAQHFVASTTSYTAALGFVNASLGVIPPYGNLLQHTVITQTGDGTLGVGKYRPNNSYVMDVAGQVNFDSSVYCRGGLQVDGGLNYSGNLLVDGVQVTGMGMMFGSIWRLWLNSSTQNLEIHQNNNTNDPTWATYTVTGILAAK
jgi:hypothetical protein